MEKNNIPDEILDAVPSLLTELIHERIPYLSVEIEWVVPPSVHMSPPVHIPPSVRKGEYENLVAKTVTYTKPEDKWIKLESETQTLSEKVISWWKRFYFGG